MKKCCRTSVGVLIEQDGRYLMFERAKFPPGVSPVAGHALDEHGTFEAAAYAEVREEVGLEVVDLTLVWADSAKNRCRRQIGQDNPGHEWRIYQAEVRGDLDPSAEETRNVRWVSPEELQELAITTISYVEGFITHGQFTARPGLEPVWVEWLYNLGYIDLGSDDQTWDRLEAIQRLYALGDDQTPRLRPQLTRDDALRVWDVMTSDDQRDTFGQVWDAVQAVRDAGDTGPFVKFTENLSVMAHAERDMPGTYLEVQAAVAAERPSIPEHMMLALKDIISASLTAAFLSDGPHATEEP